ncbi:MAG: hypothetical protein Q8O80_08370 [Devosia sp.]|nr:hypothetical protein [Devosia sp.]MDP2780406.1 hypothetical protein [Devosia sp.]
MGIAQYDPAALGRPAWNADRMVGVKKPLKQRQIWAVRFFLDREGRMRDRALFDLAIDSKLRGCDLVKLKIGTLVSGPAIRTRAMVVQQKTGRPVQFEITADVSHDVGADRGFGLDNSRNHLVDYRSVAEFVKGVGIRFDARQICFSKRSSIGGFRRIQAQRRIFICHELLDQWIS